MLFPKTGKPTSLYEAIFLLGYDGYLEQSFGRADPVRGIRDWSAYVVKGSRMGEFNRRARSGTPWSVFGDS